MKKNIRGLYITYFYLPILVPRSIVSFKHLESSLFDFDVYSADSFREEKDIELKHKKDVNVIRNFKINNLVDRFKWVFSVKKYFFANKSKYSFIMSSFQNLYSLTGALLIKLKDKNIPWVSYYSDPPGTNFDKNASLSKKIFLRFEKKIANLSYKKADVLVFTNEEQLNYCLGSYTDSIKKKAIVLSHSYSEDLYPKVEVKKEKIVISHFGRLYGIRNGDKLFEAIKYLKDNAFNTYQKMEFRFYGSVTPENELYIKNNDLDCIKLEGFVSYVDSLKAMKEANILLCIDAFLEGDMNVFFPSKLADYIGSSRPIIGIVPQNSTSARILKENNQFVVDNEIIDIVSVLTEITDKPWVIPSERDKYKSTNAIKTLDEAITKLIS